MKIAIIVTENFSVLKQPYRPERGAAPLRVPVIMSRVVPGRAKPIRTQKEYKLIGYVGKNASHPVYVPEGSYLKLWRRTYQVTHLWLKDPVFDIDEVLSNDSFIASLRFSKSLVTRMRPSYNPGMCTIEVNGVGLDVELDVGDETNSRYYEMKKVES